MDRLIPLYHLTHSTIKLHPTFKALRAASNGPGYPTFGEIMDKQGIVEQVEVAHYRYWRNSDNRDNRSNNNACQTI